MGVEVALGVAAVVMAGTSAAVQYEGGKKAERAADRAAEAEKLATTEKVKRMKEENERREATARAASAASGIGGASSEIYMDALAKAGREEIDWLKAVGASKYAATVGEGSQAYLQAQAGMWGSLGQTASYAGQTYSTYQSQKTT